MHRNTLAVTLLSALLLGTDSVHAACGSAGCFLVTGMVLGATF